MKIIAFYLPQFHEVAENNQWWGEGFTEWTNMKKAKPLFDGHDQPRVPLNHNYYDLLDGNKTLRWQIDLAKQYNVYGFCFYHYWFNGHLLLQKPLENLYADPTLNIPYCICWANENWTNAWVAEKGNVKTLIAQTYGDRNEWEEHFQYLLPFFKDPNYITVENKPLYILYRPELCDHLNEMLDYWNKRSREEGLEGLCFAYQQASYYFLPKKDESRFSYRIEYQPGYARYDVQTKSRLQMVVRNAKSRIRSIVANMDQKCETSIAAKLTKPGLSKEDYDVLCTAIINRKADDEKSIAGMFVGWDNTPRRGREGRICVNSTPEKFGHYLELQAQNIRDHYCTDMMFIFAWNEWAEGGYLEPDERYQYGYLEQIQQVMKKFG